MSKGRGPIRKDETTGTYWFVTDIGMNPKTGRRSQARRRGFKTQREAKESYDALRHEVRTATYVAPAKTTVAEYVTKEWLPAIRVTIEPSTWESYERNIRNHVVQRLGHIELQKLAAPTLNRFYAELLERGRRNGKGGLSPRSVRYLHTIIHRALGDAVRWGRVIRNVADAADPPSAKSARAPEMHTWTPAQLGQFLQSVASERLYPAFRLAAMTGMRRGEVFGLLWRDVDLEASRLTVSRQLRTVRHRLDHVEITKSSHGRRAVDLDPETVAVLRAHKARQAQEKLAAEKYDDIGLVFAAPDGGLVNPERAAEAFDRYVKRSGLPRLRFHDLRHTHAAHLIAAGKHAEVIAKRLGHASPGFTLARYGHLMPGVQADAAAAVAALVDG